MNKEHSQNVCKDRVFNIDSAPPPPILKREFPISGPRWWCPDSKNPLAGLYQMCDKCGHNPTQIAAEFMWKTSPVNKL